MIGRAVLVTMDETQIHHYTLDSNWHSAEWTVADELRPKQPKTPQSTGEVVASVFSHQQSTAVATEDYFEANNTFYLYIT